MKKRLRVKDLRKALEGVDGERHVVFWDTEFRNWEAYEAGEFTQFGEAHGWEYDIDDVFFILGKRKGVRMVPTKDQVDDNRKKLNALDT
jgi:hypothetical protein